MFFGFKKVKSYSADKLAAIGVKEEVALLVEEFSCPFCNESLNKLAGVKIESSYCMSLECSGYFKKFIKKFFSKELKELKIPNIDFFESYICPYCRGNIDEYRGKVIHKHKDVAKKEIHYKEVRKIIVYEI